MTRYSWYAVTWPITMRELAARLHAKPLAEGASDGFVVERARATIIDAAYYRRVTSPALTVDPFDREVSGTPSFSYTLCRFVASSTPLGLELIDSPRGNQSFVSRLLEICDFRLTISPLSVNVEEWMDQFLGHIGVEAQVDIVQAGSIDLGGGSTARVTIRGLSDVRQAARDFVLRPYLVEKMQVRLHGPYAGTSVVLSQSGSAKIVSRSESEVKEAAHSSLCTVLGF